MENYVGKRIDGRYNIIEVIGIGGMAVVYRAYDSIDKRDVAVKILKKEFTQDIAAMRNFKNESIVTSQLSHPNIVEIYDVSIGDNIQYIVMEYVKGVTLKEYIAEQKLVKIDHDKYQMGVRIDEAIHFMKQILLALQYAHDMAVVHRDIKPQNIMLTSEGTIKVADFGIAFLTRSATITKSTDVMGSPQYMSPEQIKIGIVKSTTDIYSAGIVLYEMLTGQLPFDGNNVRLIYQQLNEIPRLPSSINPEIKHGLDQIIMKAMQKDPEKRYQSAAEMLVDIKIFEQNPDIYFNYDHILNSSFAERNNINADLEDIDDDSVRRYVPRVSPTDNKVLNDQEQRRNPDNISRNPRNAPKRPNGSRQQSNGSSRRRPAPQQMTREELKKQNEQDKKSTKKILISLLVILVILIAAAIGIYKIYGADNNAIAVPKLVGLNYLEDIKENPTYAMFNFQVENKVDDDAEEGVVLSQNPSSGKVGRGGTIILEVASAGKNATVPDVYGEDYLAAESSLKAQNFKVQIIKQSSSSVEAGKVIRTAPARGEEVEAAATIKIYVATGEEVEKVKVPNLIGMTVSEAKDALSEVGLKLDSDRTEYRASNEHRGTIIGYESIGEEVEVGSEIAVYVSSGRPTTTVSTTASTTASTTSSTTSSSAHSTSEQTTSAATEPTTQLTTASTTAATTEPTTSSTTAKVTEPTSDDSAPELEE